MTYPKGFYVIESGDKNQTLWRIHYTVMRDSWNTSYQGPTIRVNRVLFFVYRLGWHYRNRFVEAHARAIMTIGVYVRQDRYEESRLLAFRR